MTSSSQPTEAEQRLTGMVERITFHNPENGFCVLRVKIPNSADLISVIGNAVSIGPGEYIECQGMWQIDKNHGRQYKASQLKVIPPSTREGIQKYLASGMIKGIGVHFAKQLVEVFGEQVFEIIDNNPERLMELPGIGKKRKDSVIAAWQEQKSVRDIMVFLQSHGIGTSRAVRIFKTYGDKAIASVQENPYRLALDIHGIGFKTADELAQRLGIKKNALIRLQAGVRQALLMASNHGHCALYEMDLIAKSQQLLDVEESLIIPAIHAEVSAGRIQQDTIQQKIAYFLTHLIEAEISCANTIKRLLESEVSIEAINPQKAIPWVEEKTQLSLSDSQKQAVLRALEEKMLIITGGPGVGKTTIINSVLQIIRGKTHRIALCAPTGRAARRMSDTTGMKAKTIHRLLDYQPRLQGFNFHRNKALAIDLIIIDEVSMIDIVLMQHLLRAIPDNAKVIFVGDVDQLPSVGPGNVLSDMMNSGEIKTVHLTEIFRQAAGSQIIINAHRINAGELPHENPVQSDGELSDFYFLACDTVEEINRKVLQLVSQRIPNRFKVDAIRDIQVLSPMKRGQIGVQLLNEQLQALLNPTPIASVIRFGVRYAVGDKVMQTVNNYDKDVYNGDTGIICCIQLEQSTVKIDFDHHIIEYSLNELDEISLAYACSIHKSQGSEYPVVVIPIGMQHFTLLERNLLYTAITRGKQLVMIVGEKKALAMAVKKKGSQERLSKLAERIKEV